MDIKIRNAKIEDLPEIVEIYVNGWKSTYKDFLSGDFLNSISFDNKLEKFAKSFYDYSTIVAIVNDKIVGFCRFLLSSELALQTECDGEIKTLYVATNHKRTGIGTALFDYIKNEFIKNDKHSFCLWCFDKVDASKLFYNKMGGTIKYSEYRQFGDEKHLDLCYTFKF